MRWWVVGLVGCVDSGDRTDFVVPDTGAEADTDPRDPPGAAPCPYAGDWVVTEALCGAAPVGFSGDPRVEIEGDAAHCTIAITATATETDSSPACTFTERVELLALTLGFWDAFTDAAGEPDCRDSLTGPRALGVVELGPPDTTLTLELEPEDSDQYLQLTFCHAAQRVTMARVP